MKSNIEEMQKLAESLVDYAKSKGASQAQVSIGKSDDFSVSVLNGNIDKLEQAGSTGLGLKVIVEDKVATASSSDLTKETLFKLIENAIERAKYSSVDKFSGLPEKEPLATDSDSLKVFDPTIVELKPEFKILTAKNLEKICLADKRVTRSGGAYYATSIGESCLANSNGFSGSSRKTNCYFGVEVMGGEGDNIFEDGWFTSAVNFKNLENVEDVAKKALFRMTRLLGAKKIPTQTATIVYEPNMAESLLGFLAGTLYGSSIYMKRSLHAGKIGEQIANTNINVIDDGTLQELPGSRPYDGEGVPVRRNVIVENGILKSYLLDTYSSRKLNMKSTGNASGTNNFYLAAGSKSQEEIIKSVDKGLLLVRTVGQGTNSTTGDYSKGAYGMWIEKGEITYPIAEITISGNLGTMLKNIEMVGSDLDLIHGLNAPTIKINDMTISGT
ncbi:MAG: TldD/PmbA family protein [Bacteroidota bacterium]|nr:TldD/PmbA family protein [Bacteroidota bacterium]